MRRRFADKTQFPEHVLIVGGGSPFHVDTCALYAGCFHQALEIKLKKFG